MLAFWAGRRYPGHNMDVSGVSAGTMDIAANGTSAIALSVLKGTESLVADEMTRLLSSIGVGSNVNTSA